MKVIAALVLLVAAVSAIPSAQLDGRNLPIDQIVVDYILDLTERIRARGLDPYHLRRETGSWGLPGDRILTAAYLLEDVGLNGLSNVAINDVAYSPASGIVSFDLAMPGIFGSVGRANGAARFFGHDLEAEGSGSLSVTDIRARGFVSISFGITGVIATNANVVASIGRFDSQIALDAQFGSRQYDLGQYLNRFFNVILPDRLEQFQDEINRLLAIYLVRYINRN